MSDLVIGMKDVYERLVSLGTKVDVLLAQHTETSKVQADHEQRLRGLERSRWPIQSLSVVLAVAALVISFIEKFG